MPSPNMEVKIKVIQPGTPAFSIGKDDWKKIAKGFLIVCGGAMATAAMDYLQIFSDQVDFGPYEAISIAVFSTVINVVRKYINDTRLV